MFSQRGFTLLEVLVVIAIIGLLSSVVLAAFTDARMKARNAKRLADMDQIYKALYLYQETYGCLPHTTMTANNNCPGHGATYKQWDSGSWDYSSQNLNSGDGEFMSFLRSSGMMAGRVPVDPVNNETGDDVNGYAYRYYCYSETESPGNSGVYLSYRLEPSRTMVVKSLTNGNPRNNYFRCAN
jgi:prepilin-type N-terminal cleavage/methylation domain-containing protein